MVGNFEDAASGGSNGDQSRQIKILFVDDEGVNRLLIPLKLQKLAEENGFKVDVTVAEDANTGVNAFVDDAYYMLISDYNMPADKGGNGDQLVAAVRGNLADLQSHNTSVPLLKTHIIVLTAQEPPKIDPSLPKEQAERQQRAYELNVADINQSCLHAGADHVILNDKMLEKPENQALILGIWRQILNPSLGARPETTSSPGQDEPA